MKKILILGAGIYQVPLIETAKKLGYYTIVASIPGKYPGFALADKVYHVNTTDTQALEKIAVEEGLRQRHRRLYPRSGLSLRQAGADRPGRRGCAPGSGQAADEKGVS